MKKHILVFSTTFPRWKSDTIPPFVFQLSERLSKNYMITVLAPHTSEIEKYEKWRKLKIYRYQYFWPAKFQSLCYGAGILSNIKRNLFIIFQLPFLILFGIFALRDVVRKEKIDAIHAHWIIPGGFIVALYNIVFQEKKPLLITAHSSYYKKFVALFPIDCLYKWVVKRSTLTTVVSRDMEMRLSKITHKQHKVISMGVDVHEFSKAKRNKEIIDAYGNNIFLFVGRLIKEKGVFVLLHTMREVIKKHPSTVLLMIGQGPEESALKSMIKKFNLTKNIYLLGSIPHKQLIPYYKTAKIFIAPSQVESFGLVFAEAMTGGCLVISSDLKSISDIVIHGKTGFQLSTQDQDQFSQRVMYIYEHYDQYDEIRKAGKLHVAQEFSWDNIVKKYSNIYENL